MRTFVREKKIYCGNEYLEVDCFNYTKTEEENARRGKRSKKEVLSTPKQVDWNDENSKRRFLQLLNTNFSTLDYHVSLSYNEDELPPGAEDAAHDLKLFLNRVSYRREQEGLTPLKYIALPACIYKKDGVTPARKHHHVIMSGGLDRDLIEAMWTRERVDGKRWKTDKSYKKRIAESKIGTCNVKNLQIEPNENGLVRLCNYLERQTGGEKRMKGKKRWVSSHNLDKPVIPESIDPNNPTPEPIDPDSRTNERISRLSASINLERPRSRTNDHSFSRKEVEKIAKNPPDTAYWEKRYPGYRLTKDGFKTVYSESRGWALYLKLRKKE